jgi:hypothetical protein
MGTTASTTTDPVLGLPEGAARRDGWDDRGGWCILHGARFALPALRPQPASAIGGGSIGVGGLTLNDIISFIASYHEFITFAIGLPVPPDHDTTWGVAAAALIHANYSIEPGQALALVANAPDAVRRTLVDAARAIFGPLTGQAAETRLPVTPH